MMAIRADVISARPDAVRGFLRAYRNAYARYAENPSQANAWYSEESRLPLTDEEYAAIAVFEPNLQAKSREAVDIRITDKVVKEMERNIDVAHKLGILKSKPDLGKLVRGDLVP